MINSVNYFQTTNKKQTYKNLLIFFDKKSDTKKYFICNSVFSENISERTILKIPSEILINGHQHISKLLIIENFSNL